MKLTDYQSGEDPREAVQRLLKSTAPRATLTVAQARQAAADLLVEFVRAVVDQVEMEQIVAADEHSDGLNEADRAAIAKYMGEATVIITLQYDEFEEKDPDEAE